jgi:Domain of unknown function (DUF4381)
VRTVDPASLENLEDIVSAPPVPFWPPAPGWYVVAGVILCAMLWGAWTFWRRWRAAAYRRAALGELSQLEHLASEPDRRTEALVRLAALLKRTALAAFPRDEVASLSGDAWLAFLDRTGSNPRFSNGAGRLVAEVPYDPAACGRLDSRAVDELFQKVQIWVRGHSTSRVTQGR